MRILSWLSALKFLIKISTGINGWAKVYHIEIVIRLRKSRLNWIPKEIFVLVRKKKLSMKSFLNSILPNKQQLNNKWNSLKLLLIILKLQNSHLRRQPPKSVELGMFIWKIWTWMCWWREIHQGLFQLRKLLKNSCYKKNKKKKLKETIKSKNLKELPELLNLLSHFAKLVEYQ